MIPIILALLLISACGSAVWGYATARPNSRPARAVRAVRAKAKTTSRKRAGSGPKTIKQKGKPKATRARAPKKAVTQSPAGAVAGQFGSLLMMLGGVAIKALTDPPNKAPADQTTAAEHAKAKQEGRTAATRNSTRLRQGTLVDDRSWRQAWTDFVESWNHNQGEDNPAPLPEQVVIPKPAPDPDPTPKAPEPEPPRQPDLDPIPSENHTHQIDNQGDIPMDRGNAVPATLAAHIGYIETFEAETDTDLLEFMSGEAAGVVAYAEQLTELYEVCVNSIGLDPSAVQGITEYSEAMTEAAQTMISAHAQFMAVYQEVMEAASRGVLMPHNGRFITGEAA